MILTEADQDLDEGLVGDSSASCSGHVLRRVIGGEGKDDYTWLRNKINGILTST